MEALGRQVDFILNYVKYNGQEKPHDDKNWLSLLLKTSVNSQTCMFC